MARQPGLLLRSWDAGFAARLDRICRRGEIAARSVESRVARIIAAVRRGGDAAVIALTRRHDGVALRRGRIELPRSAMVAAARRLPARALTDLRLAARRIAAFHRRQRERSWHYRDGSGLVLGQKIEPLGRVGVYIPGGRAVYPSTVLMNVIPARVAGVREVVAVSPPRPGGYDPAILAAAGVAGVDAFYQVGGAQAVAALAYGTETIPAVDKVVGPGNVYVATAKRLVFGRVGIDLLAGPSEVLVVADDSAEAELVAADMLAQAEHDELAAAVCLTPDDRLAERVVAELDRQLAELPRRRTARRALENFGAVVVTRSLAEAVDIANTIAPEHLELAVRGPRRWVRKIRHAGAVFVGHAAPEALGDYLAGPNHVLPTSGSARFASPLGVYDFVKRTSVIVGSRPALRRLGPAVERLAALEGLDAHRLAVRRRLARRARRGASRGGRRMAAG
jgi:histidinol dehydrogenase